MRLNAVVVGAFVAFSSLVTVAQNAGQQPPSIPTTPGSPRPGAQATASSRTTTQTDQSGVIRGHVIAAESGEPIRGAQLQLSGPQGPGSAPRQTATTITDDQGAYEFQGLSAGSYRVSATKTGFVRLEYGQRPRPQNSGEAITLATGQTRDRIDFLLPRGGVAVVSVTDPTGEPLPGVEVSVLQTRFVNGQRTLTPVGVVFETNDLGFVRAYGLMPGDYYVRTRPSHGSGTTMYPPTYYPGTLAALEAQRIQIRSGRETAVDVHVVAAKPVRISGVVRRSDGTPIRQSLEFGLSTAANPSTATVQLRQESPGGGFTANLIALRADGSFEVRDVIPGDYVIEVHPTLGTSRDPRYEYAHVPITVTSDGLGGIVVTTQPGATLRGRLTFDTGKPLDGMTPDLLRVMVDAVGTQPATAPGVVTMHDDYSFDVTGVAATGLLRLASTTTGWSPKSVEIDGRDVVQTPIAFEPGREYKNIEVVLTQKRATLTGQVTDRLGRPAREYGVLLFPEDRSLWYPRSRVIFAAQPDQSGGFRIDTVPEGTYLVVAVDWLDNGEEQDADLLAQLAPHAASISLRDGETKTTTLRVESR